MKDLELVIPPEEINNKEYIANIAAKFLNINSTSIKQLDIYKRSIDARSRKIVYRIKVKIYLEKVPVPEIYISNYQNVTDKKAILIVGAGPAGLFAALRCIELGLKPIIIERGKDVKQRRRDLALINKEGIINPESNYCFGEGGAGTYSDGKLFTRSNKRGDIQKVLNIFVAHGATEDILIDARPHIGTNKLPQIIVAIRETILNAGGEVNFNTKVTGFIVKSNTIKGVKTSQGDFLADAVILATGHSSKDIYYLLQEQGILLEAKPFALGVRIEHPQSIIDQSQYHCDTRSPYLPPSYYSLVEQIENRGVFSFCMCPGGIIAPCATNQNEIVVNGWSPSKRNNSFANSGTVVQINITDVAGNENDPLRLLHFQSQIESIAFKAGEGKSVAPAQRMVDFVEGKLSNNLPLNSYIPGCKSTDLNEVLPAFVSKRLKMALPLFGSKMKGYFTNEALLVGVESRTSSPVRIPRDKINLQHPQVKGLFPCAEGSGYAGGIVSAAIDGVNCVDAAFKVL